MRTKHEQQKPRQALKDVDFCFNLSETADLVLISAGLPV